MKKSMVVLGCCVILPLVMAQPSFAQSSHYSSAAVSFDVFYDGLSPHGEWISISGGVYGWRPSRIAAGWRPYTVGRWMWTSDGWYWASDEPWGWAAYHYGRWYYDDYYGWIWIPGYDWAPAWVEWRYGGDYIGWAPLSPYAVFSITWGIHYRTRWYTPVHWWSFVGCNYITSPNLHRYVYRNDHNTRYIGVTRTAGSVRLSGGRIITRGPEPEYIERRGNIRVEQARIREVGEQGVERITREGSSEQIEVFRPRIDDRNSGSQQIERPANVRGEGGRSIELDTRKMDVRARAVAREEGRDLKRAEEIRRRNESGRSGDRTFDSQRDDQRFSSPGDNAPRNRGSYESREGRRQDSRSIERRQEEDRGNQRQPEVRRERGVERQSPPSQRERGRQESVRPPQRESRSAAPERREAPRNSGGSQRSDGGRRSR